MRFTVILLAILPHIIRGADDPLIDGPCTMDTITDVMRVPPKRDPVDHWYHLSTNTQNSKLRKRKCYVIYASEVAEGWSLQIIYDDEDNQHHSYREKAYHINGTHSVKGQTPDENLQELHFSGGNGRIWSLVKQEDGSKNLLFHMCKEYGNKHREFFAIYSKTLLPKEKLEQLKKYASDLGDDREFIDTDHSNCY